MENVSNSIIFCSQEFSQEVSHVKKENSSITIDQYKEVYLANFDKIASYSFSFLKDKEESYNVANDAFLSLWENRDKVDWNKSVSPWLFFVAKNRCMNVLKKRLHSSNYSRYSIKEKADYLNLMVLQSKASEGIYEKEVHMLLGKAMDKMSLKVRLTFVLSRLKGMKYDEIAEYQNISNRTVEARIKQAMLILRKAFKDYL